MFGEKKEKLSKMFRVPKNLLLPKVVFLINVFLTGMSLI